MREMLRDLNQMLREQGRGRRARLPGLQGQVGPVLPGRGEPRPAPRADAAADGADAVADAEHVAGEQRRSSQDMMQSLFRRTSAWRRQLAQLAHEPRRAHARWTTCAGATPSAATTTLTLQQAMQLMDELQRDGPAGAAAPARARPRGPRQHRRASSSSSCWATRPPDELERLQRDHPEARGGGLPRAQGRPARSSPPRAIRKIGQKALQRHLPPPEARPLRQPRSRPARRGRRPHRRRPRPTSSAIRSCSTCARR